MNRIFLAAIFLCNSVLAGTVTIVADISDYPVRCTDDYVILGNTSSAHLPDAALCVGKTIIFKKGDQSSGPVTVYPVAGQAIDYMPLLLLPIANDGFPLFSDGTNWRSAMQTQKSRSHRTVSLGSVGNNAVWVLGGCRDNGEIVRVFADGTNSGLAIYLDSSSCGGIPYVRTSEFFIINVSIDLSRPVSIWPQGTTINGDQSPIFLKGRYEGVRLYFDGNEYMATGYVSNGWLQRSWP